MMEYQVFYDLLEESRLLTPIWKKVASFLYEEIADEEKYAIVCLFGIYFSLLDDGNICMSLDHDVLKTKFEKKLHANRILLMSQGVYDEKKDKALSDEIELLLDEKLYLMNENTLSCIVGQKKLFEIEEGYLYARKYQEARKSILTSLERLFVGQSQNEIAFSYRDIVKDGFSLSKGQELAVEEGLSKNLLITGGPGTGKTTSILFLLLGILSQNPSDDVYLVAPSGKASSRMKESILKGLGNIKKEYIAAHPDLFLKIDSLEESTIHRLLSTDRTTGGFLYGKNHRFNQDSVFVVDEASMIDICLFDSLLSAIPDGARVYLMGDRNQLPSVQCGAVYGDLLRRKDLQDHIVSLDESIRFGKDTQIYRLAESINSGTELPVHAKDWKDLNEFRVEKDDPNKPIFYYSDRISPKDFKSGIMRVLSRWGDVFYASLQKDAMQLDAKDISSMNSLYEKTENAKILSAENEGDIGVKKINAYIKKEFIDMRQRTSYLGFYPGELLMVNKNNRILDLYNGDSGILVSFKKDPAIYFMVKKSSLIVSHEGKEDGHIFKLGDFLFYPISLISRDEIDLAYAITIHKSQGSDYKNILVFLPRQEGHPLLSRQIVYTAITRTKGNTYLVSSQDRLEEAKDRFDERDTNLYQ